MLNKKKEDKVTVLLTGSHAATTGASIVDEIKKRKLSWNIHWVGKKYAQEGRSDTTLEYKVLPPLGVIFHNLDSGKIQTKFTMYTIPALLKIPIGFFKALTLLVSIKPKIILSFGGAAGSLIAFWGWFFRIPVIVHEQTSVAGRGNLFSSRFAKIVAISRESSRKFFSGRNIVLTGNPINSEILSLNNHTKKNVVGNILITGGSRGSERINNSVKPILNKLLESYKIVIQVGLGNNNGWDLQHKNLKIYEQVDRQEWIKLLSEADIVISRAGANTISELIALKKLSILIPIPWSYLDEQTENAKYMQDLGMSRIIPQDELTSARLQNELINMISNYSRIMEKVRSVQSPDVNASKMLVDLLEKNLI